MLLRMNTINEEKMSTTQPIKNKHDLRQFKNFYQLQRPNLRNYALIILGLNTALRISDILNLTYDMVYDRNHVKEHIEIKEHKTGKTNRILLNNEVRSVLKKYRKILIRSDAYMTGNPYLFPSPKETGKHLSRFQAYRIIRTASDAVHPKEPISCHSLRKTFGYYAWKQGADPIVIMLIYNHSSFSITKRYLCIEQDDKDSVYQKILF